jgi:hypothetical protein
LKGASAHPALTAPNHSSKNSAEFFAISPMRDPGAIPAAEIAAAPRSLRWSSSRYVSDRPASRTATFPGVVAAQYRGMSTRVAISA